jgi:hypothetical protein
MSSSQNFFFILMHVVLYGCGTWSLTLREDHRLRVFENRVLRGIFGPKRNEVTGGWRNCIMRGFITCTLLQVKEYEMDRACSTNGGKEECI